MRSLHVCRVCVFDKYVRLPNRYHLNALTSLRLAIVSLVWLKRFVSFLITQCTPQTDPPRVVSNWTVCDTSGHRYHQTRTQAFMVIAPY